MDKNRKVLFYVCDCCGCFVPLVEIEFVYINGKMLQVCASCSEQYQRMENKGLVYVH